MSYHVFAQLKIRDRSVFRIDHANKNRLSEEKAPLDTLSCIFWTCDIPRQSHLYFKKITKPIDLIAIKKKMDQGL